MPSPDDPTPAQMLAMICERFPDATLDDRWYYVSRMYHTADPMLVLPRFVAERVAVMQSMGNTADDIEAGVREWISRTELATLCRELGTLHGVEYDPAWLRRACRVAATEAAVRPPQLKDDDEEWGRHHGVMWAMLAVFTEPGVA